MTEFIREVIREFFYDWSLPIMVALFIMAEATLILGRLILWYIRTHPRPRWLR